MNAILGVITALLSGGLILAFVRAYLARAQKDSIIVGSAEDLAVIARGVAATAADELERMRDDRDYWRTRTFDCEREIKRLGSGAT